MLEQIYHQISGYVEFQVHGDGARLFTLAARSRMGLWGFTRRDGLAVARMKPRTYRKLRPLCRRCGARTRIVKRQGLPFQARRLCRRKGFLLGGLLGAALYWTLFGTVWGVTVTGTEKLLPQEVLRAAEAAGVYAGAKKGAAQNPEGQILALLPELSWVSVNTDGCYVEIAVKERAPAPELTKEGEPANMIASRPGKIVKVEAQEGRPQVKQGDTVSAGQVLIAGLYQDEPDPYSPPPAEIFTRMGGVRGSVIAETYREFTVQTGDSRTVKRETGRQTTLWLDVFGLRLPFGLWNRPQEESRSYREVWQARVLGLDLPLRVEKRVFVACREEQERLTKEQQKQAALRRLREAQQAQLPKGSSVQKEELEYTFTQGSCILTARCRCWEEIGEVQTILAE